MSNLKNIPGEEQVKATRELLEDLKKNFQCTIW